jgi:hypothetical protein
MGRRAASAQGFKACSNQFALEWSERTVTVISRTSSIDVHGWMNFVHDGSTRARVPSRLQMSARA